MAGIPEVALEKVVEINIVDTATLVARRDAPRGRILDWAIGGVILVVLAFAVIGVVAVVQRLAA